MKFSVIIPTCHRNDDLARCLDRLAPGAQTLPASDYEVIVTDDGRASTAEALIRERYLWARWVRGPGRGPAANRNEAARHAIGEWLAFTDDDCLPEPGWLEAFDRAASAPVDVLEGLTRPDRPRRTFAEEAPVNLTGGNLWSCNFAMRRRLFERLGGFDERFPAPAMEDCELRERLRKAGQPVVFCPAAAVVHPWRPSRGWTEWEVKHRSFLYYFEKHPHVLRGGVPTYYCYTLIQELAEAAVAVRRNPSLGLCGARHLLRRAAWLCGKAIASHHMDGTHFNVGDRHMP